MWSVSKSIISALVGIAIDHGYIQSVDTKLSEYFPELAEDDQKKDVTIRHLLTHTSGFEWDDDVCFDKGYRSNKNMINFLLERPMSNAPGLAFNYSTCSTHVLSAVIQLATGKDAYTFAHENLFLPVGMNSVHWAFKQDVALGGTGVQMTARDMAQFGQLFLNNGKWGDEQIISEEWVRESTSPQFPGIVDSPQRGYLWKIGSELDIPYYYATGKGGQLIFIVPELNLVTVVTGDNPDIDLEASVKEYILKACISIVDSHDE